MERAEFYGTKRAPRPPVPGRCLARVWIWSEGVGPANQCRRAARYDPDESGNPTSCYQHSDAVHGEKLRRRTEAKRDMRCQAEAERDFEADTKFLFERAVEVLRKVREGGSDSEIAVAEFLEVHDLWWNCEEPDGWKDRLAARSI